MENYGLKTATSIGFRNCENIDLSNEWR